MASRGSMSDILSIKNNSHLTTYDLTTLSGVVVSNTSRLNIDETQLSNHETRITNIEAIGGYTGSITVITSINFSTSTTTTKTLTYTNGNLVSVS